MLGRRKYLKFVAFVPAIVLAGGFIGYRAGAFELPWLSKPAPPEAQPASAPQPPPTELSEKELIFMSGSKSMEIPADVFLQPPASTPPPPGGAPPANQPPAIFYGSKSAPVIPSPPTTPAQP